MNLGLSVTLLSYAHFIVLINIHIFWQSLDYLIKHFVIFVISFLLDFYFCHKPLLLVTLDVGHWKYPAIIKLGGTRL